MQKTVLLYFALLFWFVVPVKAQLTFSLPQLAVDSGTQIEVDLEVADFSNVGSLQFTFSWDSSILEFVEINDIDLPNFDPNSNLNIMQVDRGYLIIGGWINLNGYNLNDGDALFTVVFDVIGNPGDSTGIALTDDPVMTIVGNPDNEFIDFERPPGYVTVNGTSSTSSPADFGWELTAPSPNPFNENSQIEFYTPQSTEVEWTIFDVAGKLILIENKKYAPGYHSYYLEQHSLPTTGTYFIQMRTLEFIQTQKVDFIK